MRDLLCYLKSTQVGIKSICQASNVSVGYKMYLSGIICICQVSYVSVRHQMYLLGIRCICQASYVPVRYQMYLFGIKCICQVSDVSVRHQMYLLGIICSCQASDVSVLLYFTFVCSIILWRQIQTQKPTQKLSLSMLVYMHDIFLHRSRIIDGKEPVDSRSLY